jgi:hypothetical protein
MMSRRTRSLTTREPRGRVAAAGVSGLSRTPFHGASPHCGVTAISTLNDVVTSQEWSRDCSSAGADHSLAYVEKPSGKENEGTLAQKNRPHATG